MRAFTCDLLQRKVKGLEDDNRKLRAEASQLATESTESELREEQLLHQVVAQLGTVYTVKRQNDSPSFWSNNLLLTIYGWRCCVFLQRFLIAALRFFLAAGTPQPMLTATSKIWTKNSLSSTMRQPSTEKRLPAYWDSWSANVIKFARLVSLCVPLVKYFCLHIHVLFFYFVCKCQ